MYSLIPIETEFLAISQFPYHGIRAKSLTLALAATYLTAGESSATIAVLARGLSSVALLFVVLAQIKQV